MINFHLFLNRKDVCTVLHLSYFKYIERKNSLSIKRLLIPLYHQRLSLAFGNSMFFVDMGVHVCVYMCVSACMCVCLVLVA